MPILIGGLEIARFLASSEMLISLKSILVLKEFSTILRNFVDKK